MAIVELRGMRPDEGMLNSGSPVSVAAIIARYSSLPPNEVQEWSADSIEDIESAILFVPTTWSWPSIAAFRKLAERLADTAASPALIVCDIDTMPDETRKLFGSLRGSGETF